jgi:hypothetical protein
MSATLPAVERGKLVKICGMLGSDHDGERASAAKLADDMLRALGLTWDAVIAPKTLSAPHPAENPFRAKAEAERTAWRTKAAVVATSSRVTAWERDFAKDLLDWTAALSERQQACLDKAYAKCQRYY